MSAAAFHSGTSPKRVTDRTSRSSGVRVATAAAATAVSSAASSGKTRRVPDPLEDPRDGVAQGDAVDVTPRGTVDDECVGRDVPGARVERERGRHPGQHGVDDRPTHGHRSNGGEVMGVAAD